MVFFSLSSVLLIICIVIAPVTAFELRTLYIEIGQNGNALVTAMYDGTPAEYIGIKTIKAAALSPGDQYRDLLVNAGIKSGDAAILCADPGSAQVEVKGFASVTKGVYSTGSFSLVPSKGLKDAASRYNVDLDLTPDITVVFPDGYTVVRHNADGMDQITHAVEGKRYSSPPPPADSCRKKDLPLSGVIPDEIAPVAAAGAGLALTWGGMTVFSPALSAVMGKLLAFIQNSLGWVFQSHLLQKETGKREPAKRGKEIAAMLTRGEIGAILAGAGITGVLFVFAARIPFDPLIVGLYVIMGGIALMMHETAHWYFNRQYSATTEVQFWGLGAIIMALTAWLFGSVFSQPTLTTVESREPIPKKVLAYINLAGPALSLLIAILCLLIIPLGGLFRTAGTIGLSVNMLTAVFSLLPVKPCEGHGVYLWNKAVWAVAFFPLLVLYFLVNL